MGSWESKVDIHRVFVLQPTKPLTYFGIGALERLDGILAELVKGGHDSVLVVTDPVAYKTSGAWDRVLPMNFFFHLSRDGSVPLCDNRSGPVCFPGRPAFSANCSLRRPPRLG